MSSSHVELRQGEPSIPARYSKQQSSFVWMDGDVVQNADARLHVGMGVVLGGLNAYEVIGGFWSSDKQDIYLFRVTDHLDRLWASAKVMGLFAEYSKDVIGEEIRRLVAIHGYREDISVRVVLYLKDDPFFSHKETQVSTGIFMTASPIDPSFPYGGIHVCTSSWRRLSDMTAPPRVKSGTNYQNARLAHNEARVNGYDDGVLLNSEGKVCELPLANLFLVRGKEIVTPPVTAGILEGITRQTIIDLAPDLGMRVVQREVDRSELYLADEIFASNTPRRIWPILSVDRFPVGNSQPGPLTKQLQDVFSALVRNEYGHNDWLISVYGKNV